MKKNIFKLALVALLAVPALQSCEMDQYPANAITNETAWQTLDDLRNFNRGTMASIRSLARLGWDASDIQADYFQPGLGYGNRGGEIYRWNFQASEGDMSSAYTSPYSSIVQFNNFLANYAGAVPANASAEEEEEVEQMLCNAYFGRAFAFYNLVVRFAKDYEPATADTDLGLVLTTSTDPEFIGPRASLQATYDFISEDLERALQNCHETEVNTGSISEAPIKFLQARVARDTHNYDEAIALADEVINNYGLELVQDAGEFSLLWIEDEGAEIVYAPATNNQGEYFTFGNFLTFSSGKYMVDWIPSQSTLDAYETDDYRRDQWFRNTEDEDIEVYEGDNHGHAILFAKHPGNPNLFLGSDDPDHTTKQTPKTLRLAEMYLLAAECAYRNGDVTTGLDYLNELQNHRGATPTPSVSATALFEAIKTEWKKEFIGEGQRIICLKRWHEGFTRNASAQNTSLIVTANASEMINRTVSANDQRFVWEIPDNDRVHGHIEGNWSL